MVLIFRILEIWLAFNFAIAAFLFYQRSPQFREWIYRNIFRDEYGSLVVHNDNRLKYSVDHCTSANRAKAHILNS